MLVKPPQQKSSFLYFIPSGLQCFAEIMEEWEKGR